MEQQVNLRFQEARDKVIGVYRPRSGIGTYGEKTVHAIFKHYCEPDREKHEISVGCYVADIYTGTEIIEIQTRQFNRMRDKLEVFLPLCPVTVVHPIPREKFLIWIDEESGELSTRRKSPKKGTPYDAFAELYRIKMYLKDPNLRIRLVLTDMEEYRLLNGWSRDKKKGSSRFDRIPTAVCQEVLIEQPEDYMQFVPPQLEGDFTVKDFAAAAHISRKTAGTAVHILHHVGMLENIGKQGNAYVYRIVR